MRKIVLPLLLVVCAFLQPVSGQDVLLDEDFSTDPFGSGNWQTEIGGGHGCQINFQHETDGNTLFNIDHTDYVFTSSFWPQPCIADIAMISSGIPVNAQGYDILTLEFDHLLSDINSTTVVTISVGNDLTGWNDVATYTTDQGTLHGTAPFNNTPQHETIDISNYISDNVQLKFRYEADNEDYWTFDNIKITAQGDPSCASSEEVFVTDIAFYDRSVTQGTLLDGLYDLPPTMEYHENNPHNLVQPGKNVRFKVQVENQQISGQSIVGGQCKIRIDGLFITLIDSVSGLNNVSWNDNGWSTDEFEIWVDANTPDNHIFEFHCIVTEGANTFETKCIPVIVNALKFGLTSIDDDSNPDSDGDNDQTVESDENIEFLPQISNISSKIAYNVMGELVDLDNQSEIFIWDGIQGSSDSVFNTTWYNHNFGSAQPINPGENNVQPQFDFVFNYGYESTFNFTLHLITAAGYDLFETQTRTLIRAALPFTFNSGFPNISVGIADPPTPGKLLIYPNPTAGAIQVRHGLPDGQSLDIQVINMLGETVYQEQRPSNDKVLSLDIGQQPEGIYFLRLQSGEHLLLQKVECLK